VRPPTWMTTISKKSCCTPSSERRGIGHKEGVRGQLPAVIELPG
jgi:hypothetical protein